MSRKGMEKDQKGGQKEANGTRIPCLPAAAAAAGTTTAATATTATTATTPTGRITTI